MKQYLDLMRHIFENGNNKGDRTGTGTRSVFGAQMRFSLRDNAIPLLTSKKVFVRGLIEELLWFLRGSTNNEELVAKNVHIWDGWALEEDVKTERQLEGYELAAKYAEVKKITLSDAQGRLQIKSNLEGMDAAIKMLVDEGVALTEEKITHLKGDLGPIYGAQWRNWRTPEGTQIDQIAEMIDLLRTKPNSRRMVVTAWNPADLPDESISPQDNVKRGRMALAACHCLFQLYTRPLSFEERTDIAARRGLMLMSEDGAEEIFDAENIPKYALSCQLYQRSADYFLGVPFNIASYAILTAMIAQVVNMVPEEFIWTGGDVHLYNNHFEQVAEQLSREPLPGPTLHLNPDVRTLEDFTVDDFEIRDYKPHATIKAPVSV